MNGDTETNFDAFLLYLSPAVVSSLCPVCDGGAGLQFSDRPAALSSWIAGCERNTEPGNNSSHCVQYITTASPCIEGRKPTLCATICQYVVLFQNDFFVQFCNPATFHARQLPFGVFGLAPAERGVPSQ